MNIKWFDINTVFYQEKLEILRIMCYDLIKQETDTIKQKKSMSMRNRGK